MKILLIFVSFFISVHSHSVVQKDLTCSLYGTDIVWSNGISWPEQYVGDQVKEVARYLEIYRLDKDFSPNYIVVYNHSQSVLRDLAEGFTQKLVGNLRIPTDTAYVLTYFIVYPGTLKTISTLKSVMPDAAKPYVEQAFELFKNDLEMNKNFEDLMIEEYANNFADTLSLKKQISMSLLDRRKLILLSESQGNLFVAKAIEDFMNGQQLIWKSKQGYISEFLHVLGQVAFATPITPKIQKSRIVLNDKDVIRKLSIVFNDLPEPTVLNFVPPINDNRHPQDKTLNHYVDGTYFNFYGSTLGDSLDQIKDFSLQSIVDVASLLESNCPKAIFNTEINGLNVKFDSTDPENPSIENIKYQWNFGNNEEEIKTVKSFEKTFPEEKSYEVKLTLLREDGRPFGEPQSTFSKIISLGSGPKGCGDPNDPETHISGKYHINPNGSEGGFVDFTSSVESTVHIDKGIQICSNTRLFGLTKLYKPNSSGGFRVEASELHDVEINSLEADNSSINISNSIINNVQFNGAFTLFMSTSNVSNSYFESSNLTINYSTVLNTTIVKPGTYFFSISNSSFANEFFFYPENSLVDIYVNHLYASFLDSFEIEERDIPVYTP